MHGCVQYASVCQIVCCWRAYRLYGFPSFRNFQNGVPVVLLGTFRISATYLRRRKLEHFDLAYRLLKIGKS